MADRCWGLFCEGCSGRIHKTWHGCIITALWCGRSTRLSYPCGLFFVSAVEAARLSAGEDAPVPTRAELQHRLNECQAALGRTGPPAGAGRRLPPPLSRPAGSDTGRLQPAGAAGRRGTTRGLLVSRPAAGGAGPGSSTGEPSPAPPAPGGNGSMTTTWTTATDHRGVNSAWSCQSDFEDSRSDSQSTCSDDGQTYPESNVGHGWTFVGILAMDGYIALWH